MNIIEKLCRVSRKSLMHDNQHMAQKLQKQDCKIKDLEQKLDISRRLYSTEKDRADKAVEGATLMADQNAFLRDAMMRLIEKGKAGAQDAG